MLSFSFSKPGRPLLYYDNLNVCTLLIKNVMMSHVPWEVMHTHEAEHNMQFCLVT
jgi:hypothetical protein